MSSAFLTLAAALEARNRVRYFGTNQLRTACPVCGDRNLNTLSAKAGHTGAALVKCFKSDCTPEDIARAVGLELSDLFPPGDAHANEHSRSAPRRVGLLPAIQALELLQDEAFLVSVAAENLANGYALTELDLERLHTASARITHLLDEVRR